jgi:hypothetical protein
MTDILTKYSLLNDNERKEVNDFLDFLLQKHKANKDQSLSSYKNKIRSVSTWSDSDIETFKINQELFDSSWKPEKW